ncbi:hypothetical protein [Motilimonas sp. E26]|uniref:hypothetical protein n=1 Tax=Motilimonas sp. E26 TaxID=2865674 RepID=UPI001E539471|nr:hypothetical protein [Motilimonas sp. E26]MCE0558396.1 hypothetical protein [Motilimonas sp. E26]
MTPDCYLAELNGYLRALSQVAGPAYGFGVKKFSNSCSELNGTITKIVSEWNAGETSRKNSEYFYKGKKILSSRDLLNKVEGVLKKSLFKTKGSGERELYCLKSIMEDINEFYGLVSSSLNEDGVFHPLIESPVYELDIRNSKHSASFYYLVRIEGMVVVTYFRKIMDTQCAEPNRLEV